MLIQLYVLHKSISLIEWNAQEVWLIRNLIQQKMYDKFIYPCAIKLLWGIKAETNDWDTSAFFL